MHVVMRDRSFKNKTMDLMPNVITGQTVIFFEGDQIHDIFLRFLYIVCVYYGYEGPYVVVRGAYHFGGFSFLIFHSEILYNLI